MLVLLEYCATARHPKCRTETRCLPENKAGSAPCSGDNLKVDIGDMDLFSLAEMSVVHWLMVSTIPWEMDQQYDIPGDGDSLL